MTLYYLPASTSLCKKGTKLFTRLTIDNFPQGFRSLDPIIDIVVDFF